MSYANSDCFISSFTIWIIFMLFSCLITLKNISSTILNESDESGHSFHVPDFRGITQIFTVEYVSCGFVIYVIYYFALLLSFTSISLRSFYQKCALNLAKYFLHLLSWSDGFTFHFLMWYSIFINLQMSDHPCAPATSPTWSWYMILLTSLWKIRGLTFTRWFLPTLILCHYMLYCSSSCSWHQLPCCIWLCALIHWTQDRQDMS